VVAETKVECPACGNVVLLSEILECPDCHREGCCPDEGFGCMPAGNNCSCPECEEPDDD
jgi:hypothetical protein